MICCILNQGTNPAINLALEEFLLAEKGDYFLIQKNEPCLVAGKHQNIFRETNIAATAKDKIPVFRRISGGGTVFHDLGNMNFSFVTKADPHWIATNVLLSPIIQALGSQGIKAQILGKNHLGIGDLKISGNAQAVVKKRLLHHGTLLYQMNFQQMKRYLQKIEGVFEDKAVNSEPRSIQNISSVITTTEEELQGALALRVKSWWKSLSHEENLSDTFESKDPKSQEESAFDIVLSSDEKQWSKILGRRAVEEIKKNAREKYGNWEWNYGYPMKMTYCREGRIGGKPIVLKAEIQNGRFTNIVWLKDKDIPLQIKKEEMGHELHAFTQKLFGQKWEYFTIKEQCINESEKEVMSFFF